MGQPDTEEEGANETPSSRKNSSGPRRVSSATSGGSARSGGWRKLLLCCLKPADDEVQELDYRHCSLNDVPPEVFTHERTLEVLYLDCNQITDLPRPLFHCHGLEELWLSDNEIVRLPHALASLINLKVLDVSKNALTEVPDTINGCKALAVLDLSVNPLGKLPEGATKLVALEELYLNDTFLEFLPANFGRLTKLRLLELRENQLATLPKSMTRLTALTRLDLGQNDVTDLPEVVPSIPSLTELWLDGNRLDVLPDSIGSLQNLVHLDASRNVLRGIAPSIGLCKSLTDVSLTSNNLTSLPDEIGDLTQLSILRVDDNQLVSLPESIGRLVRLEELQAGQNRLTKLPASIGLLRKLHTLLLEENLLEELPAELGSCHQLTVLSLRNNQLSHLTPEIGQLSRLRVMNLSCNRLSHLPVSVLKLPSLTALWLSEAQTKPIVPLQTDTDPTTGHKVLTCFLLPQSTDPPSDARDKDNSPREAKVARSPTHIKFAFDGEGERPGKLTRNPTPYPKELKALAKHAQHIQQHQPSSPTSPSSPAPPTSPAQSGRASATPSREKSPEPVAANSPVPLKSNSLAASVVSSPVLASNSRLAETTTSAASAATAAPVKLADPPVATVVAASAAVASLTPISSKSESPPVKSSPALPVSPPKQIAVTPPLPEVPASSSADVIPLETTSTSSNATTAFSLTEAASPSVAPLAVDATSSPTQPSPLPSPQSEPASSESVDRPQISPKLNDSRSEAIEIKEAKVLKPVKFDCVVEKPAAAEQASHQDAVETNEVSKHQPPPYHVAAVYSKRAAEFNGSAFSSNLQRTNSTDSGLLLDTAVSKSVDGGSSCADDGASPGRDSGRGTWVDPPVVPDERIELPPSVESIIPASVSAAFLSSSMDKVTPLLIKRATFIVDTSSSSPPGAPSSPDTTPDDADGGLQSVAALRQAAREVFWAASPRESPLPTHRQPTNAVAWDVSISSMTSPVKSPPLSAANVVGLPVGSMADANQKAAKLPQGRLPPPKYHISNNSGNGYRSADQMNGNLPELKSPPPVTATSRIPLASHNRLPPTGPMVRQTSNLSATSSSNLDTSSDSRNSPVPILPPKKKEQYDPAPPTLQPKLSCSMSSSRIPSPQVHTPATPILSPVRNSTPVLGRSYGANTSSALPAPLLRSNSTTNNNDNDIKSPTGVTGSASTRIPLPKFSSNVFDTPPPLGTKAGPSPSVSRIPTRMTSPPTTLNIKSKILPDSSMDVAVSPALSWSPRAQQGGI